MSVAVFSRMKGSSRWLPGVEALKWKWRGGVGLVAIWTEISEREGSESCSIPFKEL